METKAFTLVNGIEIPVIGFGTGIANGISRRPLVVAKSYPKELIKNILIPGFKEENKYSVIKDLKKDRTLRTVAKVAYDNGCRLFDTARAYQFSESYLGESLHGGNREELFLITKATNYAQREKKIKEELEASLKNLKTDYVDLYLLHWPQTDTYIEAWKVMEEIYASGKARAIGICNAHVHHLETIKQSGATVLPMVNELECHPLLQQWEIRQYCRENNIQLIAHTPTGKMRDKIRNSPILQEIALNHRVEIAQVILEWHYQLGDVSIPNTTNVKHIKQNLDIGGFCLSEEEMDKIRTMDSGLRIWPNPDNCDFTKL